MIVYDKLYIESHCLGHFKRLYGVKDEIVELVRMSCIPDLAVWLTKVAGSDTSYKFSIIFDITPSYENIEWLVRFSFLPGYSKDNDRIRCFAAPGENRWLKEGLEAQGYSNVEIISPPESGCVTLGLVHGYIFQSAGSSLPDLVVTGMEAPVEQIQEIVPVFSKSEMRTAIEKINRQNKQMENNLRLANTELENYKQFLKVALQEKETEKILAFYHKEYEVLPLWFKRLGHVVKIVTGHRPLRLKR